VVERLYVVRLVVPSPLVWQARRVPPPAGVLSPESLIFV
jgi:hypothetical protein